MQGKAPNLGMVLTGFAFLGFLIRYLLTSADGGGSLFFFVAWVGFLQVTTLLTWLRPPFLELRDGILHIRLMPLQSELQSPASNLAAVGLNSGTLAIAFHDVRRVQGPEPAIRHLETSFRQTDFHMMLPGRRFSQSQIDELRTALGATPQQLSEPELQSEAFQQRLNELTPRPLVTRGLIVLIAAVFLLMQFPQPHLLDPPLQALLDWGANYSPLTLNGQWWRLLTHQLVHIGILHLLLNASFLWQTGPTVEQLLGSRMYLLGLAFSGVCGGLVSLAWPGPPRVSAGASGALFGVIGMLLGVLIRYRSKMPAAFVREHQGWIPMFLIVNVYFSFTVRGIDLGAHLGGLAAGVIFGLASTPVFAATSRAGKSIQFLVLSIACTTISVAGYSQLTPVADLPRALNSVFETERTVQETLNTLLQDLMTGTRPSDTTANAIRTQVVAPWRTARLEFERLPNVHPGQQQQWKVILQSMTYREEGWDRIADAAEAQDLAIWGEGLLKVEQSVKVMEEWIAAHADAGMTISATPPTFFGELVIYLALSSRAEKQWADAMQARESGSITDGGLADRIERDGLPILTEAERRFRANAAESLGYQPHLGTLILRSADARLSAWRQQILALRSSDNETRTRWEELEAESEDLQRQLQKLLQ